jgi:hypothetical protein
MFGKRLEGAELSGHIITRHIPIDATHVKIRRLESVLVFAKPDPLFTQ